LGLLENKELGDVENPRLRALKEKTLAYNFEVVHLPGKRNLGADAVSRYPVSGNDAEVCGVEFTGPAFIRGSMAELSGNDLRESEEIEARVEELVEMMGEIKVYSGEMKEVMVTREEVRDASSKCPEVSLIRKALEGRTRLGREYERYQKSLGIEGEIVWFGDRMLVPRDLRERVLGVLHQGHAGVTGMDLLARSAVWWPGIKDDLERKRRECYSCRVNAPSQPAAPPKGVDPQPEYPMQKVAADYFDLEGHKYLVIVDRYSGWPGVYRIKAGEGAKELIKLLRRYFMTFGCPDELSSDGGKEFVAYETQEFLRNWSVTHRLSSAYFPHSNLRAETGVKSVKRILRGNVGHGGTLDDDKVARALLVYRNTPDRDLGRSPAEVLFGRSLKGPLPMKRGKYQPRAEWQLTLEQREVALAKRHHRRGKVLGEHTKTLKPLRVGATVQVQNQMGKRPNKWDKSGKIVEILEFDKYVVRMDGSGNTTLRNRRFLRPVTPYLEGGCGEGEKDEQKDEQAHERGKGPACGRRTSPRLRVGGG
jgi:hypothetical protein